MQDSQQPKITKFGQKKVGKPLGIAPSNKFPSHKPELLNRKYAKLTVISSEIFRKGKTNRAYLLTKCDCGKIALKDLSSVMKGNAGCRTCGHSRKVPKWLNSRAISAKQRCTNPNDAAYERYGGRGIEFRFGSPLEMAMYVQEVLGLDRTKEIDRINNNGHYEVGNLRLSTESQNLAHTRKRMLSCSIHAFREQYPEIKYADSTLRGFFGKGMTFDQIVERWNLPSFKPKGKYGTFLTPDPYIVSLYRDF